MTTFTEHQEYRDNLARHDMAVGDECRRWSTCNRCQRTSPEKVVVQDQDSWEDDHILFGCTATKPTHVWDEALETFQAPEEWTFTHRLEPAGDLVPAVRRYDPTPFGPRPNKPVIYTSGRPMDEERGAA
jgi:hypothetical protein